MKEYKRKTDSETAKALKKRNTFLNPFYTYLAELEDKIEQGELVSIKAVATLLKRIFDDTPCDYVFADEDVAEFMCKHYESWCEENCPENTNNGTTCWEMYLKAKLKEL